MMARVEANKQLFYATIQTGPLAGQPNPVINEVHTLAWMSTAKSRPPRFQGERCDIPAVTDFDFFDLDLLQTFMTLPTVQVYHYPSYIRIPEGNANNNVPGAFPGSTDENGDPVVWANWGSHVALLSPWLYLECNPDGQFLTGSQIVTAIGAGYTIIDRPTMQAILNA
jgi:hypothetical protein